MRWVAIRKKSNFRHFKLKTFSFGSIMSLFRLFIILLVIYFVNKVIKNIFLSPGRKKEVEGNPNNTEPLDLSNADIEDADFEELDDN